MALNNAMNSMNTKRREPECEEKPKKIEVTAGLPYPPIMVERPNLQTAKLLSFDLGSQKSELTSVTQYVYHSWQLDEEQKETAQLLLDISKVEMHHMEILGRLIILLGGNPTYSAVVGNRRIVWNGNMVTYSRMMVRMLQDDMMLEQAAIDTYQRQLRVITDKCVAANIERIIQDEEVHMKLFKQLLDDALKRC